MKGSMVAETVARVYRPCHDLPMTQSAAGLAINELEYLEMPGLNVMLAHDFYPEGHQGGVGMIQNGLRVATNGDLRLEPMPGQWSPIPAVGARVVDRARQEISVRMAYPDENRNRRGFNPIEYPDIQFAYTLKIHPEGRSFRIAVDLEAPLPEEWIGRVGFNIELFPGILFGKSFATPDRSGVFPRQALGNGGQGEDRWILASGQELTIAPEDDRLRTTILAEAGGELVLLDGRGLHNNGWFIVRALIEPGAAGGAIQWLVTPNAIPDWKSDPVIQVSQVGYHSLQTKVAVIELDRRDDRREKADLVRIWPDGAKEIVPTGPASEWGSFLRHDYIQFEFTGVQRPGIYEVRYGDRRSMPFRIADDVFSDRVWQPTVEYFLPVQMCHMRVNENYRVWHGACHLDDAAMAPVDFNHLDGYAQGPDTLTRFKSGEHVPGLECGGWHDAGDYDLRVESQADTVHGLALAFEEFGLQYDNTTIDQQNKIVEMLRPDGIPDVLQQIEHGCLAIVGGYKALGRLYRGVIEPTLRQYTHLGDASTVTDNVVGTADDRWVYTEVNPRRELNVSGALAAASRVLGSLNPVLAADSLAIAKELYGRADDSDPADRFEAALELFQASGESTYGAFLTEAADAICENAARFGWLAARASLLMPGPVFSSRVSASLWAHRADIDALASKTPYGVPYEPAIWGAGWGIQRFGVKHYWLHKAFPDIFPVAPMLHALDFILGCHPGANTSCFVSGVGAKSLIPGYGVNRADESYIPGGIASGTALIRPDFPELLEWPYLWQQTEYCVGYPTSDFVFLVAAANHVLNG